MMFSQESCQAIIEMGNVELSELKKSRVQCPSCLHHVFEGTNICSCGTLIKSNQEMIQRIRKSFEVLKTPFLSCISSEFGRLRAWISLVATASSQSKRCAASCFKEERQNLCRNMGFMGKRSEKKKAIDWNDAFVRYLDHIAQIDTSHEAPAEQRGRNNNLVFLRGIEESLQGMPLIKRPGYQEAK